MADVTGFLKYKRIKLPLEAPEERILHFREFHKELKEGQKTQQAARCMDCGIPFCHSACPLGNRIPDFNDAVYRKEWKEAYEILISTNNFPEFTGRICPAPCEGSCVLGINEKPVAIELIEKAIIERAFKNKWVKPRKILHRSGKKVAIIGSGPAGLACADDLNQAGHEVVVFEKNSRPGGLLRFGIPDFKLQKDVIDRRIEILEKEGIRFRTGIHVGEDVNPRQLREEFDAIVLTGGAEHPRDLPIKGRSLRHIHFAMEFLKQSNEKVAGIFQGRGNIDVKDKNVLVIGGGDTGSDCIGNARRQGAKSITQLEILSKPPTKRAPDNPWPQWPMTLKTSTSHKEGCEREWAVMTKAFLSEDGLRVSGAEVVSLKWEKDKEGRHHPVEIPNSSRIIPCEVVFLALGFLHPRREGLLTQLDVALDERGNVQTDNFQTSVPGIFSAGDMRRGQSLVVHAIADGKQCAEVVDGFLIAMP